MSRDQKTGQMRRDQSTVDDMDARGEIEVTRR